MIEFALAPFPTCEFAEVVAVLEVECLLTLSGGARSSLSIAMIEFALAPFPTCEFAEVVWSTQSCVLGRWESCRFTFNKARVMMMCYVLDNIDMTSLAFK